MLHDVATATTVSADANLSQYDDSDVSFRSTDAVQASPMVRDCVTSMDDVGSVLMASPMVSEKRHYCSPAEASASTATTNTTPASDNNDVGGVASQLRMDAQSWSMYCGNVLTKQTLKGCL